MKDYFIKLSGKTGAKILRKLADSLEESESKEKVIIVYNPEGEVLDKTFDETVDLLHGCNEVNLYDIAPFISAFDLYEKTESFVGNVLFKHKGIHVKLE